MPKKPKPPQIFPEPKRERSLTDDERQLWHEVMAQEGLMIADQTVPAPLEEPEAEFSPIRADQERMEAFLREGISRGEATPSAPSKPSASIDWRRARELRQGKIEPELRIDLHGMTLSEAHQSLKAFLEKAHAQGKRSILVITGKGGLRSGRETGVIKESLPSWLKSPPCDNKVLAFSTAHIRHGGTGAYYVLLRRVK